MPLATPLLSMARWLRRTPRGTRRAPEPADLGTAFGMEQWLQDEAIACHARPASPRPASLLRGRPWWRRWLRRSAVL